MKRAATLVLLLAALTLSACVLSACGSSKKASATQASSTTASSSSSSSSTATSSSESTTAAPEDGSFNGSGYPNANLSNTRDSADSPITRSTVSKLKVAWTLPLTGKSFYGIDASTPIVSDGVIYSEDLDSNVRAIDLKTGKVLWTATYESPDQGPDGLVVADGRVYGANATSAFALDEQTGKQIWLVSLVRNAHEAIDMAPGYHNGIVYVSTVPVSNAGAYEGEGVGILWALEGSTGKKLWHFDTAPENLWSSEHVNIDFGGGAWYTPAFDEQGFMYLGTGNPGAFPGTEEYPWGSSRPGPNLYTDSLLKLNASTGKLQWYYQMTPHDLYDWDFQDPPLLVNSSGRQMVIEAGKDGIVAAFDRHSGRLLWKRPVGIHNGHDHDGLYAMRHEYSKLKLPETVYPGELGGVIAPMATNGSTVFVPVVNHAIVVSSQKGVTEETPSSGELVALNVATGAVRFTHKFKAPLFAAATVVNDLVFIPTFGGVLYAFEAATGEVVWQKAMPAGVNAGMAVDGDTLIVPAGIPTAEGQTPELVALRLGG
jgi:outer membrane protein assembly factor BamB